ncbi:MAG TPA: FAD-binding oxidoreductase [Ktedonobacteraceae bacterium]|jgi:alkyldihydroxyacetonephosphate synthase|nr:FAD-binding oxidoreductase [Ktedonobacteraceae bacterium]
MIAPQVQQIEHELSQLIGQEHVLWDEEIIKAHSYDTWPVATKWKQQNKQPHRPDLVVRPTEVEQVRKVLSWANQKHIPVTPWGLGSSVTGAPLVSRRGIVLDMSAMQQVLEINTTSLWVRVQAGMLGIELERQLNAQGFTLNHSPQSLDRSSVGGWIATRATGQFSSRYGGIEDLTVAFSVVLPTGELVQTPFVPRAAIGPDLRHIFMGAEGTMGVITDVTLKIFPLPETRILQTLRFTSVGQGLNAMRKIMRSSLKPFLLRFYDQEESRHAMQDRAFVGCAMFVGTEGVKAVAEAEYQAVLAICQEEGASTLGVAGVQAWMDRRYDFSTIEQRLNQPGGLAETIEIAHFWDNIEETYQALKTAMAPYAEEVLGHFSHTYPQGTSLYVILLGHEKDAAAVEARLYDIWKTTMSICLEKGAAISHHHGVGLARLPYIREELGTGMTVLEKVKQAIDPNDILNPGKLGLK